MALQMVLESADSAVHADFLEAYAKIDCVRSWNTRSLIMVNWYADASARAVNAQPVKQQEFDLAGDSRPYAEFYAYLKTLPEFASAADV